MHCGHWGAEVRVLDLDHDWQLRPSCVAHRRVQLVGQLRNLMLSVLAPPELICLIIDEQVGRSLPVHECLLKVRREHLCTVDSLHHR